MMNRYLLLPALLLILSACSSPPDLTPLDPSGGAIEAKEVSELPLDPDNAIWREAAIKDLKLYPQRSVQPASQRTEVGTVRVQALHNCDELALRLEWADETPAERRNIGQFADGIALEWPLKYGPGVSLPYVGMGDVAHPVALWLWRADGSTETLAAEGFGSLTAQPADGVTANGVWKDGTWRVVIKRTLIANGEHSLVLDPDEQALIPVAVAVWNGEQEQRGGSKQLSAWRALYLENGDVDPAYVRQLVDLPAMQGDPDTGKRLMMEKGCIACHAFPDNPIQPTIGPGLRYAGGIHRSDYLLESIAEPSKVIVPGKGFFTVQGGQRTSLMPPFQGSEQERHDLVAYLKMLR